MLNIFLLISVAVLQTHFASASSLTKCADSYSSGEQSFSPFAEPTAKGHEIASPNEFPFMAAIGWEENDGEIVFRCGAALIDKDYVLAPGYCGMVPGKNKPKYVAIGKSNLQLIDVKSDVIEIEQIIIHPNRTMFSNDLAIFKLKKSVELKPACLLSNQNIDSQGTLLLYEPENKKYGNLLKIRVEIISNEDCHKFYNATHNIPEGISNSQVCAQEINIKDCRSSSTGPLVVQKQSGSKWIPYLVGMGSIGTRCGNAPTPAIYTKTSSFNEWLENEMA